MKILTMTAVAAGAALVLSVVACGDKDKKGKSFGAPLIKPPVDEATPEALKPSAALRLAQVSAEVFQMTPAQRVQSALTKQKGAINGGNCNGVIGCALQAMDYRIDEVNKRSSESEKKCQTQSPVDFKFEPFTGASITIAAQCNDIFSEEMSQGESGLIFGKSGSQFSIGMSLNQTSGRFGYAATYDEASSDVRYVEASYSEEGGTSRVTLVNLKANKASKTYEMYYVGTGNDAIGCGTRLVSDGTHIFISGRFQQSFDDTCDALSDVSFCLDAKDLTEVSGTCSVTAANFSLTAVPYSTVEGSIESLKTKVGASKYAGYGTPFVEDAD